MSINAVLHDVLAMERLSFPKRGNSEQVEQIFGALLEDHGDMWAVKCSHRCGAPASEPALERAEQGLGFPLPTELQTLLRAANGAELFVVPRVDFDTPHVEYEILTTDELVTQKKRAFRDFRFALSADPEFRDVQRLNYLPFCDLGDGNYLAILLETRGKGKVFFLDREGCFRPYSEQDSDMYYTLADSLEDWLLLVSESGGWGGRGIMGSF